MEERGGPTQTRPLKDRLLMAALDWPDFTLNAEA